MSLTSQDIVFLVRTSRPLYLLSGAMLYGLGASIVTFLGKPLQAPQYLFGQFLVTCLQLTSVFLAAYHDERKEGKLSNENGSPPKDALIPGERSRRLAFYAAIVCIVLAGTLASVMLLQGWTPLVAWFIIALFLLGALLYGSPPLKLISSGYGEVTASVLLAGLIPSLAFSLQAGMIHRLLLLSTTPLVALHFALMIALQVPDYASDMKYNRQRLMVRIGWAPAMWLHDIAIVFAIFSVVVAYFSGLPPRVAAGALIALPLAAAQIWQMDRLRRGFPARWRTLTIGAGSLFGLMTYLELIGYILS